MPGTMHNRNISRSPTLRRFNHVMRDPVKRADILEDIIGSTPFDQIVTNHELIRRHAELVQLAEDWFGDMPPGFWPSDPYKLLIVIEAYRKALELSLNIRQKGPASLLKVTQARTKILNFNSNRSALEALATGDQVAMVRSLSFGNPVVSHWLCASHRFQAIVADDESQITVFLMTHEAPDTKEPEKPMIVHEAIWLVCAQEDKDRFINAAANFKAKQKFQRGHEVPSPDRSGGGVFVTPIYGEEQEAWKFGYKVLPANFNTKYTVNSDDVLGSTQINPSV